MAKILSQYFTDSLTNHVIIRVDLDRHATENSYMLKDKFTESQIISLALLQFFTYLTEIKRYNHPQ